MKTLPANFSSKLQKRTEWDYSYVVKMVGSSNTYYFSNEYFTADDSGTVQVLGLLSERITIQEKMDIVDGRSSVGGFSISIVDDSYNRFSDNFATEYFYNREISVYLRIDNLTDIDDMLLRYRGLFEDWEQSNDTITISVINNSVYGDSEIMNYVTSDDLYDSYLTESVGKIKPIIYGDHRFFIADEDKSVATSEIVNNMTPCIPLGGYRYLVADHQLNDIDSFFAYKDGVPVEVTGFTTIQNTSAGAIVEIGQVMDSGTDGVINVGSTALNASGGSFTDAAVGDKIIIEDSGEIYIYTIASIIDDSLLLMTEGAITTGTGLTYRILDVDEFYYYHYGRGANSFVGYAYSDPENANNGNYSDYCDVSTEFLPYVNAALELDYPDAKIIVDDEDISEVRVFGILNATDTSSGGASVTVNSVDCDGDVSTELNDYGTLDSTNEGIMDIVTVNIEDISSSDPTVFMEIYQIYKRVKFSFPDYGNIYASVKGKGSSYLSTPMGVCGDLIDNVIGYPSKETLTASSGTPCILINTQTTGGEIIKNIGMEFNTLFFVNSENNVDNFVFDGTYTTVKSDISKDEIANVVVSKTEIIDTYSRLVLNYNKNYQSNQFQNQLIRDNSTIETNINLEKTKTYDADFIEDSTTAGFYADHYCKNSSVAFWGETHNVIEFETVDFRGLNYWDGSTFTPFIGLEMFDILEFDLDGWRKINGESWSGKQFLIIELTTNINNLKIKAVEL